mmetsp:Transcript_135123/g.431838  ORF Transcript_135123/g.431838 Transcript_135123/m.431838 type:complete len:198 (-) Transcript_135123:233-826(-)
MKPLEEHRSRLSWLEEKRGQLATALQELRDASRQEGAGLTQLVHRAETLRRELKSLKVAAEAGREGEERAQRKLEAMDSTVAASQQRQQALERSVADLRAEVQGLRADLAAAVSAGAAAAVGFDEALENERQEFDDTAIWATNLRLQSKVSSLQEQLFKKRELIKSLRSGTTSVAAPALSLGPGSATLSATAAEPNR